MTQGPTRPGSILESAISEPGPTLQRAAKACSPPSSAALPPGCGRPSRPSRPSRRGSSALESALAAERARLAALEQRISDETARLVVLEHQYAAALAALENRVRAIYESDTPDLIGFALGTTSFSDLMDNIDLLSRIGQQDERIASSLARARSELERTRAATRRARDEAAGSEGSNPGPHGGAAGDP